MTESVRSVDDGTETESDRHGRCGPGVMQKFKFTITSSPADEVDLRFGLNYHF